jgi:hypothetical protein
LFVWVGVEPNPLLLWPFNGPLYQPWMIDGDDCGTISGMNHWQGKPKCSEKTCPSAAPSITDTACLDWGSNPGLRDEKPATDLLSYGLACFPVRSITFIIYYCGSNAEILRPLRATLILAAETGRL